MPKTYSLLKFLYKESVLELKHLSKLSNYTIWVYNPRHKPSSNFYNL